MDKWTRQANLIGCPVVNKKTKCLFYRTVDEDEPVEANMLLIADNPITPAVLSMVLARYGTE